MKKKKKILLIEDEEEMSSILKVILENSGYEVSQSPDGKNIFPFYKEQGPDAETDYGVDLILLDKHLQGRSGIEICKRIKSYPPTRDIPVIIISAAPKSEEELLFCKADDFVGKPFDITDLLQLISGYLGT